ncbi:MAG: sigma-54 dependent transcriptional regulator [Nitrospirota bacterium]|nr:sigma-54 dependent transcriptional regulator [Nitrospirota bacterium]MDH5767456.1 sigma-54 dependent transcriptional regulator [Nitrospirota bacterium]
MKILVAEDDKNLRKVLRNELSDAGLNVDETDNGIDAIEILKKDEYHVVLLDLKMPGLSGMDVLKEIKALDVPIEVVVLTAHASVSSAVEAMKLGAYDYLTKPFKIEELKVIIEKAYEKKKLVSENLLLKTQIKRQAETYKIITKSPLMFEILENVKKVAISDFPVLICGESGVGKELIAKAIHDASHRGNGPFIPINCGAIPENMLESELFGHEKGAFTGAHEKKLGLLEIANQGTFFFDEISELSPQLQGKLLRAIETGSFFRVGGVKEIKVDTRFLSATNRDIKNEVEKENFRPDLYFRISTITLFIPPLRERKEDIPLLVEHTIKNNPAFKNKRFSNEALRILSEYEWPGNVRELQNVVHRVLLLSKDETIHSHGLPSDLIEDKMISGKRLKDIEREYILKVLREAGGQKMKAAEILGIDPKTIYRKLSSYGITD